MVLFLTGIHYYLGDLAGRCKVIRHKHLVYILFEEKENNYS